MLNMGLAIGIATTLIAFVSFLLLKLEGVKKYNIVLFGLLLLFWIIISMFQTNISTWNGKIVKLPMWVWPIMLGIYQFTQVLIRIPLGKLSAKLQSRKQIVVIAGTIALLGATLFIIAKGEIWAIVLTMISLGVFGATFGLQNQYWSENYNIKQVFTTIGVVALLPIIANFVSVAVSVESGVSSKVMEWILMSIIIMGGFALVIYMTKFDEVAGAMRLDKDFVPLHKISKLQIKDILRISFMILPMAIIIGLANPSQASDGTSSGSYIQVIIAPVISAVASLIVVFILIKKVKSYNLSLISRLVFILGLTFGIISYFTGKQLILQILFASFTAAGFAMYSTTMIGVMLHFDHKNALLVLGIWLTIRSLGMSIGTIAENEMIQYVPHAMKWVLLGAAIFTLITIPVSIVNKQRSKLIYDMSDAHEYINGVYYSPVFK